MAEALMVRQRGVLAQATAMYVRYRETLPEAVERRGLPSPHVVLVLNHADPVGHGGTEIGTALVAGLQQRTLVTVHAGMQQGIAVWMNPWQAYALLGMPMDRLANTVLDVETLLGSDATRLRELARMKGPAQLAALQRLLASRAAHGPRPAAAVAQAWRALEVTEGRMPVGRVAAKVGLSRRQLERVFLTQIGLPPKTVARILRFEHARRLLHDTRLRLPEIAHAAGFSDQAHLNREVRALAGCSPSALTVHCRGGMQDGAFVQDGTSRGK